MANIQKLYDLYGPEKTITLLKRAADSLKDEHELQVRKIQSRLEVGENTAEVVLDWLLDNNHGDWQPTNHLIRSARTYVKNNPAPELTEMMLYVGLGERRALIIARELERRGVVRITHEFKLERAGRMSSFDELVRQMKTVAKKYGGRCEPELLERTLYVDLMTSLRLAQYGEEILGFTWKNRPRQLM